MVAGNNEWLHFLWNLFVWLGVVGLVMMGLRPPWAWLLLI